MSDPSSLSRRAAVQRLAGLAAVGCAPSLVQSRAFAITPGVQLYTVRSEMQKSVEATLARVAAIGYREVEFAGYFNRKPSEIAALLKANGLTAPAAHVDRGAITNGWARVLDEAAAAGHQWVIVAWLPDADRASFASYQRLAADFNEAGRAAKARGLRFAFHNHDAEFKPLQASGGRSTHGHAILLAECDPSLVSFELDLYWITKAKQDVKQYVTAHPGRFPLVHVKDMRTDETMTEVGAGIIDFAGIFAAAGGTIRHFFVEHDQPSEPFQSITTSFSGLRRAGR